MLTCTRFQVTSQGQCGGQVQLSCFHWKLPNGIAGSFSKPIIIFVHQWGLLGGNSRLMVGLAKGMGSLGFESITFDLRGVGSSTGSASWTNSAEVEDLKAVINYCTENSNKDIFLVGSSAGASIVGATIDYSHRVTGAAFIGYVWGFWTSFLFSWGYEAIKNSVKPKLFIIGDKDEFTSLSTYRTRIDELGGEVNEIKNIEGKNHFEIESPVYDREVACWISDFISLYVDKEVNSS